MNYIEQGLDWFQEQGKKQKIQLVGGLMLICILSLMFAWWAMAPNYGVLFNQLDSRDANQILSQLEQANIRYQVHNQGHDILIDKALIDKTRIKLMSSDLALTHPVGFELFDKNDFGMTDFSQKINYQRALQGELERTINSLDEVRQARIHLVIPENHLFQKENNVARVAVTLHLNRPLTNRQIKSIQQLIAASVAHLLPENIVMVDQNGNSLTHMEEDDGHHHFAAKKRFERYLTDKVTQLLGRIFKDEQTMVRIDATLNYDELQRELEKPHSEGFLTHEKESQRSRDSKSDKKQENLDFNREKSYQYGHEKERFIRANGTLERLTISVALPKETDKEKMLQIERLVKSVVGFDAKRGDTISVEALIVDTEATPSPVIPLTQATPAITPLAYISLTGLLSLFLAGLILRIRTRRQQRQQLLSELKQWLTDHD